MTNHTSRLEFAVGQGKTLRYHHHVATTSIEQAWVWEIIYWSSRLHEILPFILEKSIEYASNLWRKPKEDVNM